MKISNKLLLFLLGIVWTSVLVKYESFALSRSGSSSSSSSSSRSSSSSSSRIRESIRSVKNKVKDKLHIRKKENHIKDPYKPKVGFKDKMKNKIKNKLHLNPKEEHGTKDKIKNKIKGKIADKLHLNPKKKTMGKYANENYYPDTHKKSGLKDKAKGLLMAGLAKKLLKRKKHRNGYNDRDYRGDYLNVMGSTCYNDDEYNGIVFGKFTCPMNGFRYDETECCGFSYQQYCCSPREANLHRERESMNRRRRHRFNSAIISTSNGIVSLTILTSSFIVL